MIIKDIKLNRILPFEIEDVKLVKLFSFYLHSAPTIESKTAAQIDSQRLLKNWLNFKTRYPSNVLTFFSASYSNDNFMKSLVKYKINEEAQVNRKTKVIVCKKKDTKETEPNAYYAIYAILSHITMFIYQMQEIENTYCLKTLIKIAN